jgi:predicted CXXCH cytochrome family protein
VTGETSSSDLLGGRKGWRGGLRALAEFFVLSFPARLMLASLVAFGAAVWFIVSVVTDESTYSDVFEPWLHTVAILAQRDFEMSTVEGTGPGHDQSSVSDYSLAARIVRFDVTDLRHVVSISTVPEAVGARSTLLTREEADQAVAGRRSVQLEGRAERRVVVRPVMVRKACAACHQGREGSTIGYVYAVFDTAGAGAIVREGLFESGRRVLLVLLILGLALAVYFLRGYVRPAQRLARHMQHMADSPELEAVEVAGLSPEFRKIAEGYNRGVERLKATRRKLDRLEQERMMGIERLATIGRMSAMMAHEIRNPLAGISGAVRILAEELPLNEEQREVVAELMRQTHRLSNTVTELLARARPRREDPTLLEPCGLVDRVAGLLRPGMQRKRVQVSADLDARCTQVYADEEWLVQILLNLLLNSEQAMPDGGRITIRVGQSGARPGFVAISVEDDGPGMPPAVMQKALVPFFTTKADGTGLGLTISRDLVERMGGVAGVGVGRGGRHLRAPAPADRPRVPACSGRFRRQARGGVAMSIGTGRRAWRTGVLLGLGLAAVAALGPAAAAGEPQGSCVTASCHRALTRFKVKHAAMDEGCVLCHEARLPVTAGAAHPRDAFVKLEDQTALCGQCHESAAAMASVRGPHGPAAGGRCSACHAPHGSADKGLLRAAPNTMCAECHGPIGAPPPHPHPPVAVRECTSCHAPHGGPGRHALAKAMPELCLECHDTVRVQAAQPGSVHQPVAEGGCPTCHAAHGSQLAGLLVKDFPAGRTYHPFSVLAYGLCFGCHDANMLYEGGAHTGFQEQGRNLHRLHVVDDRKGRTCRVCHDPHAADQPHLLRTGLPFGTWKLPILFEERGTGGTCQTACHGPKSYSGRPPMASGQPPAAAPARPAGASAAPEAAPGGEPPRE